MVRDFTRGDRRRGPRPVPRADRRAAATRSPPASAAGPTRSGCSRRSSTTRRAHLRLRARGRRASTPGGTPRRSRPATRGAARRPHLRAAGRGRPDHRVALDLGRARLPRRRPAARAPRGVRRPTYLPITDAEAMDALALLSPHRGHHRGHRVRPRARRRVRGRARARARRHRAGQPLRPRRQGHGDRARVVPPRRRRVDPQEPSDEHRTPFDGSSLAPPPHNAARAR